MDAANAAISSPLLEDASVKGARGVIINVTGGPDLSLIEVSEASAIIQEAAHEDANIIFGAVVDPKMEGQVKITVIATGFDRVAPRGRRRPRPRRRRWISSPTPRGSRSRASARPPRGGSRLSVSRRAVLEMPRRAAAAAKPRPTTRSPGRRIRAGVAARRAGVPAAAARGVASVSSARPAAASRSGQASACAVRPPRRASTPSAASCGRAGRGRASRVVD